MSHRSKPSKSPAKSVKSPADTPDAPVLVPPTKRSPPRPRPPSLSPSSSPLSSPTLAELMNRQGVTQMEISGALGIHQSYVSLICSGKRVPSLGTSRRMAAYLGVTLDEWWGMLKRRTKLAKPAKPATKKRRK